MGQERQQSGQNTWRHEPNHTVPESLGLARPSDGRRTTAAAVRHQINAMLGECLPDGWIVQAIAPRSEKPGVAAGAQADILVISPRGRCFFLLVKAPADRWWDGDIRRVSAEPLGPQERGLMVRLRQAGHGVRAVWNARAAARALTAWGCPLRQPNGPRLSEKGIERQPSEPQGRQKLTLAFAGKSGHGA